MRWTASPVCRPSSMPLIGMIVKTAGHLQFRNAGLKEVVEALGKAAHVNFVFDKDVRNDPITVSLEEAV